MTLALVIEAVLTSVLGALVILMVCLILWSKYFHRFLTKFGWVVLVAVLTIIAHWLGTQILEVIGGV